MVNWTATINLILIINRGTNYSQLSLLHMTMHVHRTVNASIQCSQNSSVGGLGEGQQIQNIEKLVLN